MSPTLLENFALLAASEGGVAKLRELILSLAVRGKLVPQDPADEPASELLKRIRAEKERLVAEGKIKREKKSPQPPFDKGGLPLTTSITPPFAKGGAGGIGIADEEKPFELPEGWKWASLGAITLLVTDGTHHTPKYLDKGIPFISVKDINGKTVSFNDCKYVSENEHEQINARCNPQRGDILLCRIGTLGRPTIVDTDQRFSLFVSVGLLKLPKTQEISRYLHLALSSPFLAAQFDEIKAGGSHTNKLNLGDIPSLSIPLPPLPEQSRIVAKVEALMALCDRLEAQQGEAARVQAHWTQAALDQLAESGDADEFARNWQALADHFDTLFATPASIDALDATLLQLAVRGKLVPQNPADEPASELLKHIRAEKDRLIAEGKIKRDKKSPQPPFDKGGQPSATATTPPFAKGGAGGIGIADDEKPFELPEGWAWIRSADVYDFLNGYAFKSDWFQETGIRLLRNINVAHGQLEWTQKACITEDRMDEFERFALDLGDIVISLDRPIISTGLKYAVVRESDLPCLLLQRVAKLWPRANSVTPRYTELWLKSDVFVSSIDPGRSNGVPHISTKQIESIPFPLPPLPEQSRIVAKLDELLALTRTLRARIKDAHAVQARLASALVDEVAA